MIDKAFFEEFEALPQAKKIGFAQMAVMNIIQKAASHEDREEGVAILNTIGDSGILDVLPQSVQFEFIKMIKGVKDHICPPKDDPDFPLIQAEFAKFAMNVVQTKDRRDLRHMVTCAYDGVPYSFSPANEFGDVYLPRVPVSATGYKLIIERHHDTVKAVFDYINQKGDLGDLWVMVSAHYQLQAFFGNSSGYLGILYLSLVEYAKDPKTTTYTLVVNGVKNNPLFKVMNIPGVKVRKSSN